MTVSTIPDATRYSALITQADLLYEQALEAIDPDERRTLLEEALWSRAAAARLLARTAA